MGANLNLIPVDGHLIAAQKKLLHAIMISRFQNSVRTTLGLTFHRRGVGVLDRHNLKLFRTARRPQQRDIADSTSKQRA